MFCRYCGKQIEENEICKCQQTEKDLESKNEGLSDNQGFVQNQNLNSGNLNSVINKIISDKNINFLHEIANDLLGIIKEPFIKGNLFLDNRKRFNAIGIIIIQAFFVALFGLGIILRINGVIENAGDWFETFKFSAFTGFFLTLFLFFLNVLIFLFLYFIGCKIIKKESNIDFILSIIAIKGAIALPLIAVSIVLLIITPKISIILIAISIILSFIYLVVIFWNRLNLDKNKLIYVIFIFFITYILLSIFIYTKSLTYYIPKSIENLGLNDLLGSILF